MDALFALWGQVFLVVFVASLLSTVATEVSR